MPRKGKPRTIRARKPRMIQADRGHFISDQISFAAPVEIAADARPGMTPEQLAKAPKRFDMVAYTGDAMNIKGWKYPVVVDLQGVGGMDKSRPALKDHDPAQIVGHTDRIAVADGQLVASGIVSGTGAAAQEVQSTSANGFPWQASQGAKVIKNQFIPDGDTVRVNGREFQGPINIARRTSLGEISFVALGADDNTSARVAARKAAGVFQMTFEEWLKAKGFDFESLTAKQKKGMKASYTGDIEAAKAADADDDVDDDDDEDDEDDDDEDDEPKGKPAKTAKGKKAKAGKKKAQSAGTLDLTASRQQIAAETDRISKIRTICASAGNPEIELEADGKKTKRSIEAAAIEDGWDVTRVELETLRAKRPTGGPYVNTGGGQDATFPTICAALAMSGGIAEKHALAGLNDQAKEVATSKKIRGMGLHQAMYMIASANGIPFQMGRIDNEFLRAMFAHDRRQMEIQASGGSFSTMSLSGILENVLNKMLLQSYDMAESVVDDLCWVRDTNDFKPFKSYRMTALGSMEEVGPNGELKNVSLQDETYQNQLKTRGGLIVIDRQKIISDDMGAITQTPQALMELAMVTREKVMFKLLAAAKTTTAPGASINQMANGFYFISAGAANYQTGASSALGIDSLATARKAFRQQKDANGNPIMVTPDRILCTPALETTADNLFQGANLVVSSLGSTASRKVEPNLNAHKGKYKPVVSPWFDSTSPVAGFTDTNWMLMGPPESGKAPLQIGYLNGQRTPIIERGEANFNVLGIYLRLFYDFGLALHDYRTTQWNDGQ